MKNLDKYFLKARLWPTVLTSLPIISFYWHFIRPMIEQEIKDLAHLGLFSNIAISAAIVFLLIQINRFLSKEIFQRYYFNDETRMPSTNYLLWSDQHYSIDTKNRIKSKIKNDFDIDLKDEEFEKINEPVCRKEICIAVSQIRVMLKDNYLLKNHNIEYGFIRNLLGGCILAVFISIVGLIIYWPPSNPSAFLFFVTFAVIYLIPIVFSKMIIKKYSGYYAKILFEQYLSIKPQVS